MLVLLKLKGFEIRTRPSYFTATLPESNFEWCKVERFPQEILRKPYRKLKKLVFYTFEDEKCPSATEDCVRILNLLRLSCLNISLINSRYRYDIRTQSQVAEGHFSSSKISQNNFFNFQQTFLRKSFHLTPYKIAFRKRCSEV